MPGASQAIRVVQCEEARIAKDVDQGIGRRYSMRFQPISPGQVSDSVGARPRRTPA